MVLGVDYDHAMSTDYTIMHTGIQVVDGGIRSFKSWLDCSISHPHVYVLRTAKHNDVL